MRFDATGMYQAFDRMSKTAQSGGKDLAKDQGYFFLRIAKKLGWEIAPSKEELQGLTKLGWRIKRRPGVKTPEKEIARRLAARGAYARSWIIEKIESERYRIRIWIKNKTKYSGILESEKHVTKKAADYVGGRFKSKLERLAKQCTASFIR